MDFLLKQRLVGAIVLVALGVIFIPMLLEGPNGTLVPRMEELPEFTDPRAGQALESLPPADAVPGEPETAVVTGDPAEPAGGEPGAPVSAPAEAAAPQPDTAPTQAQAGRDAVPEPAPAPEPEPEPVAESGKTAAEPGPLGGWIVQVGSFSNQQNALVLRDQLRKSGFVTQVEKVQVGGKTHYRVRVGPFLDRPEADSNQRQLSEKFSLNARVMSYP